MKTAAISLQYSTRRLLVTAWARATSLLRRDVAVERHVVRHRSEWAIIYIDEKFGAFVCQSSFGTYAYIWRSIGKATLKEFLADLNFDYFMGKTRPDYRRFDRDLTIKGIRTLIRESRREHTIDRQTARTAWTHLDEIEHNDASLFFQELTYSAELMKALGGDYYDLARETADGNSVGFWKVIWPKFLEQIAGKQ